MQSRMVRESTRAVTWNEMRAGKFALMRPVMTSTDGRCVATIRWMPAARAFCARRVIGSSTLRPTVIIRSASSSMITTTLGRCSCRSAVDGRLDRRVVGILHGVGQLDDPGAPLVFVASIRRL